MVGVDAEIFVSRLRLHALIGVDPQERVVGNDFEVSVSVTCPSAALAGKSDSLNLTVNYAEIVGIVRNVMSQPMELVEHAASRIIESLKSLEPQITSCMVTIAKIGAPVEGCECDSMGVTFRWSR